MTEFSDETYQRAFEQARRQAIRSGVSRDTAEDVASEVVAALIEMARVEPIDNLGGYVYRTTRNVVSGKWRSERSRLRREKTEALDRSSSLDDAIAQVLDAQLSAEQITMALSLGLAAGDESVGRVVSAWLKLAEQQGKKPTQAEVASLAEVSRPTVRAALDRFGKYLRDVR